MKRTFRIILWTFVTITGIFLFGALIFSLDYLKVTYIRQASESGAINDSVWCIKDMDVNAYLFKGKTGYILIDAGSDKKNLSKELDKLEIKAKKISAVFLTRTVEDHYGSLGLFKNAVIYMSRDEELMIKGRTKHNNPIWKYGSYTLLNNNDSLNVDGLKIKILATPDNAPGSSDFVIGSGYLATGDNLVLKNRNPEQFSEKSNKNIPTDPANYKYVLTTHYGFVRE